MRNVKIAAIQMQCSTNLQANLEKAEKWYDRQREMVRRSFCCRNFLNGNISASSADMIFIIWQSLWKKRCGADGHAAGKGIERRIAGQLL